MQLLIIILVISILSTGIYKLIKEKNNNKYKFTTIIIVTCSALLLTLCVTLPSGKKRVRFNPAPPVILGNLKPIIANQ